MAPVLVNGSPKLPRLPMPSALDHESFDITLHRKDTEGFGFVILTSKSKPPHGGESLVSQILHQLFKSFITYVLSLTRYIFESLDFSIFGSSDKCDIKIYIYRNACLLYYECKVDALNNFIFIKSLKSLRKCSRIHTKTIAERLIDWWFSGVMVRYNVL